LKVHVRIKKSIKNLDHTEAVSSENPYQNLRNRHVFENRVSPTVALKKKS